MKTNLHLIETVKNTWYGGRAGRYIACDMHVHVVSKAGSLISGKPPSPILHSLSIIMFIIEGDSSAIMKAILLSLPVINGSVY